MKGASKNNAGVKTSKKTDTKATIKADMKTSVKTDVKTDVKTSAKTDMKTSAKADTKTDTKTSAKSIVKVGAKNSAFIKHLSFTTTKCELSLEETHNDFKREATFLQQALQAAVAGRKRLIKAGIQVSKPHGYFSEMIKTQEQMSKISKSVESQKTAEKEALAAKKQRQLKLFGKKIQTEKLVERQQQKTKDIARITQLRKKRKAGSEVDFDKDEFDIQVDEALGDQVVKSNKRGKKSMDKFGGSAKRQFKNEKFGFGGKKRGMKRNTVDSLDDFEFNAGKNKKAFRGVPNSGATKRRGAGKGTGKGTGKAMGKGKGKGYNRPGKKQRQTMQSKMRSKR